MKYLLKICAIALGVLGFAGCVSSQKLVSDPPFTLGEVRLEPWSVGQSNTVKGVNIYLPVQESTAADLVLDSLYYQGKGVKLQQIKRDSYLVYIGRFMDQRPSNLILHADPQKEFGNKPTSSTRVPPYKINQDQALLRFSNAKRIRYFKVTKLIPSSTIHYKELPASLKY